MTLELPGSPPAAGRLRALNPVVALAAGLVIDLVLLARLDPATAAGALLAEIVLTPLAGLRARVLLRRLLPVALVALLTGVTVALYGTVRGPVLLRWWLVTVSSGSLVFGFSTVLRLLAIALPAVVLLAGLDATRLADALGQRLHLPARFVIAGLAATRLVELFAEDWRTIALARRARGVGDGGALRRLPGQSFGLLVVALRRATALATAMEARGFGAEGVRTWARPSFFGRTDVLVGAAALCVAAVALTAGLVVDAGVR